MVSGFRWTKEAYRRGRERYAGRLLDFLCIFWCGSDGDASYPWVYFSLVIREKRGKEGILIGRQKSVTIWMFRFFNSCRKIYLHG